MIQQQVQIVKILQEVVPTTLGQAAITQMQRKRRAVRKRKGLTQLEINEPTLPLVLEAKGNC